MPELSSKLREAIENHRQVLNETEAACLSGLASLADVVCDSLENGGKVLFFGNGGSAADAQHLASELTVRFVRNRRALAGLALTTDTSVLTACGNDLGFDLLFSRQIEALGRQGDVAIGFSTSGNSPNVINALQQAKALGLVAVAFTGACGGRLNGLTDIHIAVPSTITARIQEIHILLGHLLCQEVEDRFHLSV